MRQVCAAEREARPMRRPAVTAQRVFARIGCASTLELRRFMEHVTPSPLVGRIGGERSAEESGRGGRDRTGDHLLPKQIRYRCATPRKRRNYPTLVGRDVPAEAMENTNEPRILHLVLALSRAPHGSTLVRRRGQADDLVPDFLRPLLRERGFR